MSGLLAVAGLYQLWCAYRLLRAPLPSVTPRNLVFIIEFTKGLLVLFAAYVLSPF